MASSDAPIVGVSAKNEQLSKKASSSSGDEAALVIKNPTDGPGTLPFSLSLPTGTTVGELKQELNANYPGSPPIQAQRLIYAGKLLRDGQKLREFLSPHQQAGTPHTIHLVVSYPQQTPPSSQNAATANQPSTHTGAAGGASGTQLPQLPQFAYNGQFLGGQVPIPLQEAMYAHHLQVFENVVARTLQNGNGAQLDPRTLAQMHAADVAAAAAAANAMDGRTPTHGVPPPLAHANGVFPGMMPMHPDVRFYNVPHMNMAAAQHAQHAHHAHTHQQPPLQRFHQNGQPQPHPAQQQRGFNGFHLDVQIGRHGLPNGMRNALNAQNQPHVRQFVFQIEINWALIAKLLFIVYLLGHEGNSSRVYSLIIAALGIYLWQTGHLEWFRRLISIALPSPGRLIENLFPQQTQQHDAQQEDDSRESPPARQNPYGYPALIFFFVYSFVYGIVCSLLPAWNPQPLPRIDQIVQNPDRPQEEPDVGANHEHVD